MPCGRLRYASGSWWAVPIGVIGVASILGVGCDAQAPPPSPSLGQQLDGGLPVAVEGGGGAGCAGPGGGLGDPELLWPEPWPNTGRSRWRTPCPSAPAEPVEDYGLDEVSRHVPATGPLRCPEVETTVYRGSRFRYQPQAKIYTGFRERLVRFEAVVVEVAEEIYGRPPQGIRQLGTYHCRRTGRFPTLASEHSLGNAIDVEGFDFGPLPAGEAPPEGLPDALRRSFAVRVLQHWPSQQGVGAVHARFLRELIERLQARRDVFRVLLGPGYPGHKNHFHFDCAKYRMIEGFE